MTPNPSSGPRGISGRALVVARVSWVVFAVLTMGLFVAAIPARHQQLITVSPAAATTVGQLLPAEAEALARQGLSVAGYAAFFTTLEAAAAFVFFAIAALIFVVRSQDRLALLASTAFILAALSLPVITALDAGPAAWHELIMGVRAAFVACLPLLLFLFPDGRFVPRWTRWLSIAWLGYTLAVLAWPALQAPMSYGRRLSPVELALIIWDGAWFGAGVLAQVYRYNRVATPTQRQQTKWVVFGFAVFIAFVCAGLALLISSPFDPFTPFSVFARLVGPTLILAGAVSMPLAIGISILRFRLWDIDLIIRRTLVYSVLTGLLALAYFIGVLVLQNTFGALTGQQQSPLVTVLSTLMIAALFVPLRRRVQAVIDRRFYRRHYDAGRILAVFGEALRDEVELAPLQAKLMDVVEATMQPQTIDVWLLAPEARQQ
jgi:hypothetical protein